MREIKASQIAKLVEKLCIEACCVITDDIKSSFKSNLKTEQSPLGREILETLIQNVQMVQSQGILLILRK